MLIGLLSDSHGQVDQTARAVAALREAGAEMLLHMGDIETEGVIDELVGHHARIVFGNCDVHERELARYAELVGVRVDHPAGRLEVGGRTLVYTHGHLEGHMRQALDAGVDYFVHGHTHEARDERCGGTRVINPGALYRARRYTVALLDAAADELRFIDIGKE